MSQPSGSSSQGARFYHNGSQANDEQEVNLGFKHNFASGNILQDSFVNQFKYPEEDDRKRKDMIDFGDDFKFN